MSHSAGSNSTAPNLPGFVSHQVVGAQRFFLNLNPAPTRDFTVVCGGVERCRPDYIVKRIGFPFWAVEFVAGGSGEVVLDGVARRLRAGAVFTYGPGIRHEIRSDKDQPLDKYFVDFVARSAKSRLVSYGLSPGHVVDLAAVGDVRGAFDALIRYGLREDERTARTCSLQLEMLLHTIARSRAVNSVQERRSRAAFERCRQYIDAEFFRVQSLADVATACALDASHVCRLFRRFHSESPRQYLQRRRMHWAADRLLAPGVLVREVAEELQMDPFHFSRVFKRVHGLSPLAFLATRG